jgi:transglutaminase-like putative cysteine protease
MSDLEFTPYGWPVPGDRYLAATDLLDFDVPAVAKFVADAVEGAVTPTEKAVRLFSAVRDRIRYDTANVRLTQAGLRASTVVTEGGAFCIPKAALLVAAARCAGIPAGIGLSDVVNHFSTPKMLLTMGGREVFMHHGWAALYLEGRWVKAVPAFNKELCVLMGVPPTEFDGTQDAVLQQYKADGSVHMEYLRDHGVWSDVPLQRIEADWAGYYPPTLWCQRPTGA